MPSPRTPRSGSMQFWPRKRSKRIYPKIRSWKGSKEIGLLGFAGYKAGMTHINYTDLGKHSLTKGDEVSIPVTVIECPPIKIAAVRFYKHRGSKQATTDIFTGKDKELNRKISIPKNPKKISDVIIEDFDDIRVIVYTQPKLVGLKKKPEVFELALSGKKEEKFNFVKENLDKEITIDKVFKEGQFLDTHAITKGKGTQGPVKRFGIDLKRHKSEKSRRNPGVIGAWDTRWHMYRVAHAGQTGFQQRIDHNKLLIKISDDPESINPDGGFLKYGVIKNPYVLIKGSVSGPRKRLIFFTSAHRKESTEVPQISYTSTRSKQGR